MRQPGDFIVEDRSGFVFHGRSGKRPYLAAMPLTAALVAIVAIGALGPRPGPSGERSTPLGAAGASAAASLAAAVRSSTPEPSLSWLAVSWTPEPNPAIPPDVGLARMRVNDDSIRTAVAVPSGNPAIAFSGHHVYVGAADQVYWIDFDGTGEPRLIATMQSGYTIAEVATTGTEVVVLGSREAALARNCSDTGCPTGTALEWEILLMNPDGSDGRIAERFVTSDGPDYRDTPHLAATYGLWAVSRPGPDAGVTGIEVRFDSGQLMWSTSTRLQVMKLALGVSRLAAVLMEPIDGGARTVAVADALNPSFTTVASASWDGSISADGQNAAWDDAGCISTQDGFSIRQTCPRASEDASFRSFGSPCVDNWDGSPITVWGIDTLDGRWLGLSAPLLGPDVWFANAERPDWFGVRDSLIVWASYTKTGVEIHQVDLATAGYQIE